MSEDKNTELKQGAIEPEASEGADELVAVEAAGTDIGAVGALERIATLIRQQLDAPEAPVFATGGDAPFFLRHLPHLLTPAPPMLTLRGTAVAKA